MIKLTKINTNPDSEVQHASTIEEYRIDQERGTWGEFFEGKSPPVDYWVVGELLSTVEEGKPILIDRWNRNGVVKRGTMMTSIVNKIEEDGDQVIILTKSEAKSLYDSLGDALGEKKVTVNDISEKLKPIIDKQKDEYDKWPKQPFSPTYPNPIGPYPRPYEIWCKVGDESPYSTDHIKKEL